MLYQGMVMVEANDKEIGIALEKLAPRRRFSPLTPCNLRSEMPYFSCGGTSPQMKGNEMKSAQKEHDASTGQGTNSGNGTVALLHRDPAVLAAREALVAAKESKSGVATAQRDFDNAARSAGIFDHYRPDLVALGERFAQMEDTGETILDTFAYANSSLSFGNGQFPHVPFHFNENLALDAAMRSHALNIGRGAANAVSDDDINVIVSKAEDAVDDEGTQEASSSLLVRSIDWFLYTYNLERQSLKSEERQSLGYIAEPMVRTGETDGQGRPKYRPATSFADRQSTVMSILNLKPSATLPAGKWGPYSGKSWSDVIASAIVAFIAVHRPENWKGYKAKDGKAASVVTTNGTRAAAEDMLTA